MRSTLKKDLLREIELSGPVVVFRREVSKKFPFLYISSNVKQFGYKPLDIVNGKISYSDIVFSDDRGMVEAELKTYTESGLNRFEQYYRLVCRDHRVKWVYVYTNVVRDNKGIPLFYDGYILDTTEVKKVEDALRDSDERYRRLVDISPEAIVVHSHGRIIFLNEAGTVILGAKTPKDLIGKLVRDFIHPESRGGVLKHSKQMLENGSKILPVEEKLIRVDGSVFDAEVSVSGFKMSNDHAVLVVIRDITERKKSEAELKELNAKLLKSNKKLVKLTVKDPHTGIFNYRYLEEIIEKQFQKSKRFSDPFSLVMIDLDYFKSINDVYGHQFGDLILKQFAQYLTKFMRSYDITIRYGGEEFVIICPNTGKKETQNMAQRLLDSIQLYSFGNKKHSIKLKVSMAVSSYPEDYISKGLELVGLADKILSRAKESGGNRVYSSLDIDPQELIMEDDVSKLKDKIEKLNKRAKQSLMEAIFAFAKTLELKDHSTGEHVERTVKYATDIARELKLPKNDVELVRQAAILHDLGKIGISEKILIKKSKLSKQEYEEIKKHPQIAADILRPIQFLHSILPFIIYHHERWDGKGYPYGISGNEIPVGARIISVADVYQALISDRSYRKALSRKAAIKIIKEGSGTQFDPKIAELFLKHVSRGGK